MSPDAYTTKVLRRPAGPAWPAPATTPTNSGKVHSRSAADPSDTGLGPTVKNAIDQTMNRIILKVTTGLDTMKPLTSGTV